MLNYGTYVWVSGAYIAADILFLFIYCHLCPFGLFTWRSERFIECTAEFALISFVDLFFHITMSTISLNILDKRRYFDLGLKKINHILC